MRYLLLLFLVGTLFIACKDDDEGLVIDPYLLHYDGPNETAPILPVSDFEAGVFFPRSVTNQYGAKKLVAIEYYIKELAEVIEVNVSENTGGNIPGALIFSQTVTSDVQEESWNRIDLNEPINIDNGLWLSVYFKNAIDQSQTIGCDAGPGKIHGDWLWDKADGQWRSYLDRYGQSINWNIRGILEDQ